MDDVLVAVLALEPLADLLAGVAGPDHVHPVARRAVLALRRDDLDDVAVLEPVVERDEPVVDLRPDRPMADVGVDPVREVERRRAGRQVLDVALRGEDEDLVLEDVELDALDELGRVADVALPVHQLAQPGELGVVLAVGLGPLLVAPVGGDADLGDLVHLRGSGSGSRAACRRSRSRRCGATGRGCSWGRRCSRRTGRGSAARSSARSRAPRSSRGPRRRAGGWRRRRRSRRTPRSCAASSSRCCRCASGGPRCRPRCPRSRASAEGRRSPARCSSRGPCAACRAASRARGSVSGSSALKARSSSSHFICQIPSRSASGA